MPNRLARETSPYLLQHANNPVDWFPWGELAFTRAREENKPILLSVGYAACHWCHVMERESFEDPEVAALMNEHFVSVKVDREERPDIDEIYMRAVQAINGQGGWPMTVALTPDGRPFFGGTYFPPEPRHGLPSFRDVLRHLAHLWERGDHERPATQITAFLRQSSAAPAPGETLRSDWLERIVKGSGTAFDRRNGGFGGSPKFPPHGTLAVLLAAWALDGDAAAAEMATQTLDGMAKGGTYDLLGGGFARYSVDAAWRIPHFEKMLYDNAQLLPLYTDAYKLTGDEHYARIVRETIGWALRDMALPGGGFAASTDADSEGEEGRYFVWTARQIAEVAGEAGSRVCSLLGVTASGTFEHGASVLRLEVPLERLPAEDRALLLAVFPKLLAVRDRRVPPGRDDKLVTAWNALFASALARAGAAFGEPAWIEAAARTVRFLEQRVTVNGRLMRTWKDDRAHVLGYADDHAALLLALLDLYEATFEPSLLDRANALADRLVTLFWDADDGGLWYTGKDAPPLVTRSKNLVGGAEPSGNGLAALAFVRLGTLCGRADLLQRAELIARSFQGILDKAPRALGVEAIAATWLAKGGAEIAIAGPGNAALLAEVRRRHLPTAVLCAYDAPNARLPWTEGKVGEVATAYLCRGFSCRLPTREPAELARELDALRGEAPVSAAADGGFAPARVRAPALPTHPVDWLNTAAPLSLAQLRGNVVVLDFWTHCCVNCLHVLPELERIEAAFAGKSVAVIGIHSAKFPTEKERESVAHAISRQGIRHPVVLDPDHRLWSEFAVRAWPTVIVLDVQGRVAWQHSGEIDAEDLLPVINRLLAEGEKSGELTPPVWQAPEPVVTPAGLRHPGKVHVWPATQAQDQLGLDALADGRLYIADSGHHRIVECALTAGPDGWPAARVLRVFGGPDEGFHDGDARTARFRRPQGVVRLGDTLYVADTENHALRAIDLEAGDVGTLAGTGARGGGDGLDPHDPLNADLRSPWAVDGSGVGAEAVVFVAMAGSHQIWVWLEAQQQFGPLAGSGAEDHVDGELQRAALAQPSGLSLYGRFLFFADSEVSSVRAVDLQERNVVTAVGRGLFDFGDVDGVGEEVRLQHPLDVSAAGTVVFVADTFNHKIKKLAITTGTCTTLAGGEPHLLNEPGGLARAGRFLVVADTNNHRLRVVDSETGELRDLPLQGAERLGGRSTR